MNTQKKKFRITKITPESVYLRWEAYRSQRRGLSIKVPVNEFVESYHRIDQNTCERKELEIV